MRCGPAAGVPSRARRPNQALQRTRPRSPVRVALESLASAAVVPGQAAELGRSAAEDMLVARFWTERTDGPPFDWAAVPAHYWPQHLRSVVAVYAAAPPRRDRLLPAAVTYCVEVCGFTFRFGSLAELAAYRDYFAAAHPPSQRRPSPRRARNTGDRRRTDQTRLARVPLWLKAKVRRAKVAAALAAAAGHFARESTPNQALQRTRPQSGPGR